MDKKKLTEDWIQYQLLTDSSADKSLLEKSVFKIGRLTIEAPEDCWEIILAILYATDDELVLANLSAGPLESLLAHNADIVIVWIEEEAAKNQKFKSILSGVWQNLMPDEIWERVQKLIE